MEFKLDRRTLGYGAGAAVILVGLIQGIVLAATSDVFDRNGFLRFLEGFSIPFGIGMLIIVVMMLWGDRIAEDGKF